MIFTWLIARGNARLPLRTSNFVDVVFGDLPSTITLARLQTHSRSFIRTDVEVCTIEHAMTLSSGHRLIFTIWEAYASQINYWIKQ
jgi:hypothetical protein